MSIFCPLCGEKSQLSFQTSDVNRRCSEEVFSYYRCSACDLLFLTPIPADLTDYYPPSYHVIPKSLDALVVNSEPERYKIDIILNFIKQGRLLEIGPASGGFSYLAKNAGFEVEAIEMDKKCCDFLNQVVGIRAINSHDESAALRKLAPVHVIALWHVIEHLPEPWIMLEEAAKKLLPGGILVIAAPNPAALQFKILGKYWTHVDAPRHVSLIPLSTLTRKMKAYGMQAVLQTTRDAGSIGWNSFGWRESFANFFVHPRAKRLARIIGTILTKVLAPLESREGRGSAYTVVFRQEK